MTFFDTGILVAALLAKHSEHERCRVTLLQCRDGFTDAHVLAGLFAVPADIADYIEWPTFVIFFCGC